MSSAGRGQTRAGGVPLKKRVKTSARCRLERGMSLVEVLIAGAIFSLIILGVLASSVTLAESNVRAEVQSVQVAVAGALLEDAARTLPAVGSSVTGSGSNHPAVSALMNQLPERDREVVNVLSYTVTRPSATLLRVSVRRSDLSSDPHPLTLEVTP